MEEALLRLGVEVPALAVLSISTLLLVRIIIDVLGSKLDRQTDVIEKQVQSFNNLTEAIKELVLVTKLMRGDH